LGWSLAGWPLLATFICPAGSRFLGCRADSLHESTSFSQTNVREVQADPPPWRGLGDLPEPSPQAEAGL